MSLTSKYKHIAECIKKDIRELEATIERQREIIEGFQQIMKTEEKIKEFDKRLEQK